MPRFAPPKKFTSLVYLCGVNLSPVMLRIPGEPKKRNRALKSEPGFAPAAEPGKVGQIPHLHLFGAGEERES